MLYITHYTMTISTRNPLVSQDGDDSETTLSLARKHAHTHQHIFRNEHEMNYYQNIHNRGLVSASEAHPARTQNYTNIFKTNKTNSTNYITVAETVSYYQSSRIASECYLALTLQGSA